MSFQGDGFQNDAFQLGGAGPETQLSIITDGNDVVAMLHGQDAAYADLGDFVPPPVVSLDNCIYPAANFISGRAPSSDIIPIPGGGAGDLLITFVASTFTGAAASVPTGWVEWDAAVNRLRAFYKLCDGTETDTVTLRPDTGTGTQYLYAHYRIISGTFAGLPSGAFSSTLSDFNADPPAHTAPFGTDNALWLVVVGRNANDNITVTPNGYDYLTTYQTDSTAGAALASRAKEAILASDDPSVWTFDASRQSRVATVVVQGYCVQIPGFDGSQLDWQDFTDFTDYGFSQDAIQAVTSEDSLLGVDGYFGEDWTDFTDLADYGTQTDVAIDDNDQGFLPASVALDDQDFTDLADYGSQNDLLADDFTAPEDFILGDAKGLDDQDFTDTDDYGFYVVPLSDDNNDFVLGDGTGLDDQDWTDQTEYGWIINNPVPDNDQEFLPASVALDDQDWTDQDDYGFINNPDFSLDEMDPDLGQVNCDEQDFTDLSDYGFQTDQAIPDNNPEISPSTLDDQDFTDSEEYGFSYSQMETLVTPEDFLLGTGAGLDEQDWTDTGEYGFVLNAISIDFVPPTLVTLTGYSVYVLPSDACQIIVVIWNYAAEPAASWTEITQPSNSWNEVSQPTLSWSVINDVANAWSTIPDVNLNWNQVC